MCENFFKENKVYIDKTCIDELKNFNFIFSNFLSINNLEKFKTKDLIVIYIPIINKESSSFELIKKFIYDLVNKILKENIENYD